MGGVELPSVLEIRGGCVEQCDGGVGGGVVYKVPVAVCLTRMNSTSMARNSTSDSA